MCAITTKKIVIFLNILSGGKKDLYTDAHTCQKNGLNRISWTRITGSCEPPDMDVGN